VYPYDNVAVKWTLLLKSLRMENRPVFKKQSRKIILKAMLVKFHSAHIDGAFNRQILKAAFSKRVLDRTANRPPRLHLRRGVGLLIALWAYVIVKPSTKMAGYAYVT